MPRSPPSARRSQLDQARTREDFVAAARYLNGVPGGNGLLPMFADEDERMNATWPAYDAALKAAGVRYAAFRYPGTQHGFNNDTTPRYDADAARLARQRTIALFTRSSGPESHGAARNGRTRRQWILRSFFLSKDLGR